MACIAARGLIASVIALTLLAAAAPASAVIVELKTGQRVEGALRTASSTRVLIDSGGQILVFQVGDIRAIYFTAPPLAAPAVAPGAAPPAQPPLPGTPAAPSPPATSSPAQPPSSTPAAPAPDATSPPGQPPTPGTAPAATAPGAPAAPGAPIAPGAPATAPPTPAAAPAPVSPAVDALQTMKALRASIDGGVSPLEYGPQVGRARVAVERYFASMPGAIPPGGEAMREAVRYYQIAEFAWRNHSIASDTVWLQRDDILDRCPRYREFTEAMQNKGEAYYNERTRMFLLISDGVLPVLWSCAADLIGEAEQAFPTVGKK